MLSRKAQATGSAINPELILVFDTSLGDLTVEIPFSNATSVNVNINWGDGSAIQNYTTANSTAIKTYATGGIYTVRVSGSANAFGGATVRPELTQCLSFGKLGIVDLTNAFRSCANLTVAPTYLPSTVTNISSIFRDATSFNQNINSWNTANVTNMANAFFGATLFNQPLSNWNTANVTTLNSTFRNSAFNQDISSWNVSNVTLFVGTFQGTPFNQNIGSWNTSNGTDFNAMFRDATSFNQNIGSWNVSSATNLSQMFQGATSFNQNIGSWKTGNATSLTSMFSGATAFNQNLSSWCVGWFIAEPQDFSLNSGLTSGNLPVWGTCPSYTASGSITYVGSASGVDSATLPTHQAGDIIIAFAFRDGGSGITLPSGWSGITQTNTANFSSRIAYLIASGSGTSSGTWTNATTVEFLVYRGDFDSTRFGNHFTQQTASSTTVTYPANGYWQDLSWVIAFAGHRSTNTSLETAPTGLTRRRNTVDATDETASFDSTGLYGNWPSTSVSVGGTSSDWRTYVLRLKSQITPT